MNYALFSPTGLQFRFHAELGEWMFFADEARTHWCTVDSWGKDWIVTRDRRGQELARCAVAGPHRGNIQSVRSAESLRGSIHAVEISGEEMDEIWLASLDGSRLKLRFKLDDALNAAISPGGRYLAWLDFARTLWRVQELDPDAWRLGRAREIPVPDYFRHPSRLQRKPDFIVTPEGAVWTLFDEQTADFRCARYDLDGRVFVIPNCIPLNRFYVEGNLHAVAPLDGSHLCRGANSVYRVSDGALAFESTPGRCRCLCHGNIGLNHALAPGLILGPEAYTLELTPNSYHILVAGKRLFVMQTRRSPSELAQVWEAELVGTQDSLRNLCAARLAGKTLDVALVERLPPECKDVLRGFEAWARHHNSLE